MKYNLNSTEIYSLNKTFVCPKSKAPWKPRNKYSGWEIEFRLVKGLWFPNQTHYFHYFSCTTDSKYISPFSAKSRLILNPRYTKLTLYFMQSYPQRIFLRRLKGCTLLKVPAYIFNSRTLNIDKIKACEFIFI